MTTAAPVYERPGSARTRARVHAGWYDPDSAAFDEGPRSASLAEADQHGTASNSTDMAEVRDSFVDFDWS